MMSDVSLLSFIQVPDIELLYWPSVFQTTLHSGREDLSSNRPDYFPCDTKCHTAGEIW